MIVSFRIDFSWGLDIFRGIFSESFFLLYWWITMVLFLSDLLLGYLVSDPIDDDVLNFLFLGLWGFCINQGNWALPFQFMD